MLPHSRGPAGACSRTRTAGAGWARPRASGYASGMTRRCSAQCHGQRSCFVAVLDEGEVPAGIGVATGPSHDRELLVRSDAGQALRFDLTMVQLDGQAEVDLGTRGRDPCDQSRAAFSAYPVPCSIGQHITEHHVVAREEVPAGTSQRGYVDDVLRAEQDTEMQDVPGVMASADRGGVSPGRRDRNPAAGQNDCSDHGDHRDAAVAAAVRSGLSSEVETRIHHDVLLRCSTCQLVTGWWSGLSGWRMVPVGDGAGLGAYLTGRLRVKRAAMPDSRTVQPSRTRAATPGARNCEASLPPLVLATAAPVGSHFATEGNAGCRMPTSMTNPQAIPPMMAPTVLRVSAPRATPSSP